MTTISQVLNTYLPFNFVSVCYRVLFCKTQKQVTTKLYYTILTLVNKHYTVANKMQWD